VIHILNGAQAGNEFTMAPDQQKSREYHGTFTPDGQQILFDETLMVQNGARLMEGPGKGVFLMDRDRHNPLRIISDGATQPVMTPDLTQVLYLLGDTLYSWVRKTGEIHRLTSNLLIKQFSLSPDAKHIILLAW